MSAPSATPTEYKGVRYRSKSEAMFARWLDLTRGWITKQSHSNRGATGSGHGWIYEPDWMDVDGWRPDFFSWYAMWAPTLFIKKEVIEYKPSKPTDVYIEQLGKRFESINSERGDKFELDYALYYGSPYSAERGLFFFLMTGDGLFSIENQNTDWMDGVEDKLLSYRFDLRGKQ